jgi:hypothetical protein
MSSGFRRSGIRTTMKYISELNPAAAQPKANTKVMTNAMSQKSQPTRRNQPSGLPRPQARNAQSAQRNNAQSAQKHYERYLALARAEAVAGDRIAAENYFQHAEHYFRSMGETPN